jgi:hypothetical protein
LAPFASHRYKEQKAERVGHEQQNNQLCGGIRRRSAWYRRSRDRQTKPLISCTSRVHYGRTQDGGYVYPYNNPYAYPWPYPFVNYGFGWGGW